MSVQHHVISHVPGGLCGVSIFKQGRPMAITIVVSEHPDNNAKTAFDGFVSAAQRIARSLLKGVPPDTVVWIHRSTLGAAPEILTRAYLAPGYGDVRWEPVPAGGLDVMVNRHGGFCRRGVFIPAFRSLAENGRHRTKEVVTYATG